MFCFITAANEVEASFVSASVCSCVGVCDQDNSTARHGFLILAVNDHQQCEGMGEVGSERYEPALLPLCPSIISP